jgi:UDP-glucose 4-epimerase
VFFAVGDKQYSIAEIAHAITKAIGRGRVKSVEWPKERKAIEIGDAIINNQKIKRTLDWTPCWDLEQGLAGTKEYFTPCLERYLG